MIPRWSCVFVSALLLCSTFAHATSGAVNDLLHIQSELSGVDAAGVSRSLSASSSQCAEYKCGGCTSRTNYCARGTLYIDPWLSAALKTQRQLAYDQPLDQISMLATHNSAITKSEGYGEVPAHTGIKDEWWDKLTKLAFPKSGVKIANQKFSVTDQLRMGIRHVELDVHYAFGDLRICHAGGVEIEALDKFINWINKHLRNPIKWDTQTLGCFSSKDTTFDNQMGEVTAWLNLPENQQEVIILYLDDKPDLAKWGLTGRLLDIIRSHLGSMLLTPVEFKQLYPTQFPTAKQLVESGKRVIMATNADYGTLTSDVIFTPSSTLWPNEFGPKHFDVSYPNCGDWGDGFEGKLVRIVDDSLHYGPFYSDDGPLVRGDTLTRMVECNIWAVGMDDAAPDVLEAAVWTWAKDEPKQGNDLCTAMDVSTGRWKTVECSTPLPVFCQGKGENRRQIHLSNDKVSFSTATTTSVCGDSATFSVPVNAFINRMLKDYASSQNQPLVWVNWAVNH